jgi:Zn-dependent peptidase ImmA (M78 family)/transcriptional regulator with XRE-family HTH domain
MTLNPEILVWARDKAGLSLGEAARRLGFQDAERRSAVERLAGLESGEHAPSKSVLRRMAKAYRRSLLVFYLDEPPRTGDRGLDFRVAPGMPTPAYDPLLDALIRDIRTRQSIVRSLLEAEEAEPLDFVGSVTMATPPAELADRIPRRTQFLLQEFRGQRSVADAFAYLRDRLEASGIFVLLLGNLGSHHTNVPVETFRGFTMSDPVSPFLVVNDQDAQIAWSFTALHEAVHIWLGVTGVSSSLIDAGIEQYCNEVAGEILLPRAELQELAHIEGASVEKAVEAIDTFAQSRKVSRPMVAYKLLRSRVINGQAWRAIDARFKADRLESKEGQVEGEESDGGPSYYIVKRHRLGRALLDLVDRSLREGSITYTRAGQVLGVKPRNIDLLLRRGH